MLLSKTCKHMMVVMIASLAIANAAQAKTAKHKHVVKKGPASAVVKLNLPLQIGEYAVERGDQDNCLPFKIKELPKKEDSSVYVSPLYSFYAANHKIEIASDVDPGCTDLDENSRKDNGSDETVITQVSKHDCKDEALSTSVTRTFTLKPGMIRMDAVEKGASYSCWWIRNSKAKSH